MNKKQLLETGIEINEKGYAMTKIPKHWLRYYKDRVEVDLLTFRACGLPKSVPDDLISAVCWYAMKTWIRLENGTYRKEKK